MGNGDLIATTKGPLRQAPPAQKSAPVIYVENIKTINKGSLRAFCSVLIGGLKIHSVRIVQEDGKAAWVSLPQQEWTGQDGKKRYAPIVEVPDHIKAAIQESVLQVWEAQRR